MVSKTKGASPAFIKELMRRAAQFQFEAAADGELNTAAFDGAMTEMVFSGGTLNLKLLGGSETELRASDGSISGSSPIRHEVFTR